MVYNNVKLVGFVFSFFAKQILWSISKHKISLSVAHHVVCSVVRVRHAILETHDANPPSERFVVEQVRPNDRNLHLSICFTLFQVFFFLIYFRKEKFSNRFNLLLKMLSLLYKPD